MAHITGTQARLARAALRLKIDDVAALTGLGVNTISRFELTGETGHLRTVQRLLDFYRERGVEFPDRRTIRLPDHAGTA